MRDASCIGRLPQYDVCLSKGLGSPERSIGHVHQINCQDQQYAGHVFSRRRVDESKDRTSEERKPERLGRCLCSVKWPVVIPEEPNPDERSVIDLFKFSSVAVDNLLFSPPNLHHFPTR